MSDTNMDRSSLSDMADECEIDEFPFILNRKEVLQEILIRAGIIIGSVSVFYGIAQIVKYYNIGDYLR